MRKIYIQESKINEIKIKLDSLSTYEKCETIMKCVEHCKKGWMALKLIDYCNKESIIPEIPEYIENCFKEVKSCNACK